MLLFLCGNLDLLEGTFAEGFGTVPSPSSLIVFIMSPSSKGVISAVTTCGIVTVLGTSMPTDTHLSYLQALHLALVSFVIAQLPPFPHDPLDTLLYILKKLTQV